MKYLRLLLIFGLFLGFGACAYTIKVKDGQTAYERKYYATAAPMLEKEYKNAKSRVEKGKLAFLIGECNRYTGQYANAIKWYEIATQNSFGPDALRAKAYMLKQTEVYTDAQAAFKQLGIEIGSQYEYRREITACTVADTWKKELDSSAWLVQQANFNSTSNDFSPNLAPDGRIMFSSDRASSTGKGIYAWTKLPFMDLYIVEPESASAQLFDLGLNTDTHEAAACFHPNGQEIWFTRSVAIAKGADAYTKIFHAVKTDGKWQNPEMLEFQKERINYMHPYLGSDAKTLYFSCNDGNWGGYDICYLETNRDGVLEPRSLPRAINTGGDELFPVWNGDTLYFSSNDHTGMGGLDIFKTYKLDTKTWAPPINLKAPINSGFDDFGLMITKHEIPSEATAIGATLSEGYFSSNRPNGKGGDDIYHFTQRVPRPKLTPPMVDTVPAVRGKILLDVYVLEKIFAVADNPNSAVVARRPIQNAFIEMANQTKVLEKKQLADGIFSKELLPDQNLQFKATADGFLAGSNMISTVGFATNTSQDQKVELEIVLDRIYRNQEIVLENIYYDYDRAEIRSDAEPTLNKLAQTLEQNPSIKIQLGSHTDCRGQDRYNRDLSQRRAQSAVNYLIAKGIAPERLSAIGYGEAFPTATCACQSCTEVENQANRRTTFKIVE